MEILAASSLVADIIGLSFRSSGVYQNHWQNIYLGSIALPDFNTTYTVAVLLCIPKKQLEPAITIVLAQTVLEVVILRGNACNQLTRSHPQRP